MDLPPVWALGLIYWLHMLATVVWIGGLTALSVLVLPVAGKTLDAAAFSRLLEGLQRRFDPLGWLCLLILVGTGLFQMSANPNYRGFLMVNNRWAIAILLKHLVFIGMIAASAALTWGILPRLRRAALRRSRDPDGPELNALQQQEVRLLRLNLLLSIAILALTALARAS